MKEDGNLRKLDVEMPILINGIPQKSENKHCKTISQVAKQVSKRRKKNKNKKTHRVK